jgi:hypothetical protein
MLKIYRYSIPELSQKLIKSGLDYETTEPLRCIFEAIKHGDIAAYFEPSKNLVFAKANLFDGLNLIVPNHHNKDYIAQNILPISEVYLYACDYSISSRDPRYPEIEIKAIKSGGENVYIYQTDRDFLKRINGFKINASDVFMSADESEKLAFQVNPENEIIVKFDHSEPHQEFKKTGKIKQPTILNWLAKQGIKTQEEQRVIKNKICEFYGIKIKTGRPRK